MNDLHQVDVTLTLTLREGELPLLAELAPGGRQMLPRVASRVLLAMLLELRSPAPDV